VGDAACPREGANSDWPTARLRGGSPARGTFWRSARRRGARSCWSGCQKRYTRPPPPRPGRATAPARNAGRPRARVGGTPATCRRPATPRAVSTHHRKRDTDKTDTGRHRQTQKDTDRHRQTQIKQTKANTERHRQTQTGTVRHIQAQSDTGICRHTQTDTESHRQTQTHDTLRHSHADVFKTVRTRARTHTPTTKRRFHSKIEISLYFVLPKISFLYLQSKKNKKNALEEKIKEKHKQTEADIYAAHRQTTDRNGTETCTRHA
jgi:hypothetical protein